MAVDTIQDTDFGTTFKVTMQKLDTSDLASVFDISSYTTKEIEFLSPTNQITVKAATFETDGQDGIITFTTADTTIFLGKGGMWHYRGHVAKTGADFTNFNWLPFKVDVPIE